MNLILLKLFVKVLMNIYKVTRISDWDYDEYSSFVCFAKSEEEAINLNPSFVQIDHPNFNKFLINKDYHLSFFINWDEKNKDSYRQEWVNSKDDIKVTKIGTSESKQIGIILARYHAG